MNLIYYRGLNCHLACVISIAAQFVPNYQDAFAALWSETDFKDDSKFSIYTSKQVFTGLSALGAQVRSLNCTTPKETAQSLAQIAEGELFFVGMDTFHIPWNPVYHHFRGTHYFFSKKQPSEYFFCFDPVYNKKYTQIKSADIINYAFELGHIRRITAKPPPIDLGQEAREILLSHPRIQKTLSGRFEHCRNEERNNITPLIMQIDAMMNNRYMFQRFLQQSTSVPAFARQLFNDNFFARWEAVKNGLYKASILKNNESVLDEVCGLLLSLLREETAMAEDILSKAPPLV